MRGMKKFLVTVFFFSIVGSVSAEWIWTKKASLPYGKRDRAVGFSIGGFGFIGTGMDSVNMVLNDFWKYDTLTNSWSQVASLPGMPRRDAASFVIGNFAYVGIGIADSSSFGNTLNDFYRYDPVNNHWDSIAHFQSVSGFGVYKAASTAVNGKGYVFGGRDFGYNSYECYCYDPVANSWSAIANFPWFDGRSGGVAFAMNSKCYICCGEDENYYYNDLWEFDPALNTWTQKENFPGTSRIAPVAFTINNTAFVGTGTDGGYKRDFWSYDANSNSWNYVNMFDGDARRSAVAFSIGNSAYLSCGKSAIGTKKDLWRMTWHQPFAENVDAEFYSLNNFSVYPNVISRGGEIHLTGISNHQDEILEVYDIKGKLLTTISSPKEIVQLNFTSSGEYFLRLKKSSTYSLTQKILVW